MDYNKITKELKKVIKELKFINPLDKKHHINPEDICKRLMEFWRIERKKLKK